MASAAPENTGEKQTTTLFQPGQSGNPAGRPKGARSKLGEAFLVEMLADFEEHGRDAIKTVRDKKPDQYLKVVASILPKELDAGEATLNILSELLARVDGRTRTVVPAVPTFEIVE
jgi:hypothetical protein